MILLLTTSVALIPRKSSMPKTSANLSSTTSENSINASKKILHSNVATAISKVVIAREATVGTEAMEELNHRRPPHQRPQALQEPAAQQTMRLSMLNTMEGRILMLPTEVIRITLLTTSIISSKPLNSKAEHLVLRLLLHPQTMLHRLHRLAGHHQVRTGDTVLYVHPNFYDPYTWLTRASANPDMCRFHHLQVCEIAVAPLM